MKNPWIMRVAFLCVGLVVGLVFGSSGRFIDSDSEGNTEDRESKNQGGRYAKHGRQTSADFSLGRKIKSSDTEEIADLLYLALEEPDAFLRQGHVYLALLKMNESNWREMYEKFGEITWASGKRHHPAWKAALERSGQVGGQDAVELHLNHPNGARYGYAWDVLYGWAQAKPNEAMAWLEERGAEDPALRGRLLEAVIAGHTLTSPKTAPSVLESLPSNERRACVGHFTWNLVQSSGIDTAIDWMLDVNERYSTEDPEFSRRVTGEVMGTMAATTAGRGGTDLLAQRIKKIYQHGEVDPGQTRSVITRLEGTGPLDLMLDLSGASFFDELNSNGNLAQEVVNMVRSRSPEQFEQWVASHPDAEFINVSDQ